MDNQNRFDLLGDARKTSSDTIILELIVMAMRDKDAIKYFEFVNNIRGYFQKEELR